jgi:hypothetical protein
MRNSNRSLNRINAAILAAAALGGGGFGWGGGWGRGGYSLDLGREVPPTPEPEQTPEQKEFYLRRAEERRARKAAKRNKSA